MVELVESVLYVSDLPTSLLETSLMHAFADVAI